VAHLSGAEEDADIQHMANAKAISEDKMYKRIKLLEMASAQCCSD
jgi:hypothetical protein